MFVVRLYVTLCDCDGRRQSETHCRLHIYASEPAVHAVCRVSGNYALTWSRVPKYLSTWVSRTPSGASANPHPLALLLLPHRLRSPGVFPAFVRFVSPLPLRDPPSPSPTPVRTRLHSTALHSALPTSNDRIAGSAPANQRWRGIGLGKCGSVSAPMPGEQRAAAAPTSQLQAHQLKHKHKHKPFLIPAAASLSSLL